MHSSLSFFIALLALLMTLSTLASAQNTRGSTAGSSPSNSSPRQPFRGEAALARNALEDVYVTLNDGSLLHPQRTAGRSSAVRTQQQSAEQPARSG